jgi:glutathione S-transferase
VEYLEDSFPEPALRPATLIETARARQIARFAELYVVNRILWGGAGTKVPLATMMPISGGKAPVERDDAEVTREAAAILHALTNIERLVAPGAIFALGDGLTIADGALLPYLSFARYAADYLGIAELRSSRLLGEYLDGIAAVPGAFATTYNELQDAMAARRAEVIEKFGPLAVRR